MKNAFEWYVTCPMFDFATFDPNSRPTRSLWPNMPHAPWSTRPELSIALFKCTLWQSCELSTLTFDLGVWPRGLKINRLLALDHSDPHAKFERNRSKRSGVIVLKDGQTWKSQYLLTLCFQLRNKRESRLLFKSRNVSFFLFSYDMILLMDGAFLYALLAWINMNCKTSKSILKRRRKYISASSSLNLVSCEVHKKILFSVFFIM